MKLRMADRIASQLFNTLNTLMQRVAMNAQPLGGPDHVTALLQQRFQRLQQQPWAFAIGFDQASEGVVHKIAQQGGIADGGEQLDKAQLLVVADALGWTQAIAEVQRLTRLRQRARISLQLLHRRRKTAQQR